MGWGWDCFYYCCLPYGGCSDSWLDSSAIAQISRSSTSAAMLILGFKGVLGELAAGMACALPSGGVVHSSSLGEVEEY